jgi:hypothetical protein
MVTGFRVRSLTQVGFIRLAHILMPSRVNPTWLAPRNDELTAFIISANLADRFFLVLKSPRRGCGRATSPSWVLVVRSDAPARGLFRTPGPRFRGGRPAAFAALPRPPFQPHQPGFPGSSLPVREGMGGATALAAEFARRKFGVGEQRYWEMAPPAFAECRWHSAAGARVGAVGYPKPPGIARRCARQQEPLSSALGACAIRAKRASRGRDRILTAPPARGDGEESSPR